MELPQTLPAGLLPVVTGLALLALGGLAALVWWRRRRSAPATRLRRVARDMLSGFVIPDADAGQIQIEHALLTPDGILVLDVKEVEGHVFGSNAMQDWTVLSERRRFTFQNPQPALYDRIAAVRRLVPEVPVRGHVVFTARARFTKGRPDEVILLEELVAALGGAGRHGACPADVAAAWERLRMEAVTARVGGLMRD